LRSPIYSTLYLYIRISEAAITIVRKELIMNHQSTIEKMKLLKLTGMLRIFTDSLELDIYHGLTPAELLGHMIDAEYDERYNNKLDRLIKNAGFRYKAGIEDLKYSATRNLEKSKLLQLADCQWIKNGLPIVITGKTGVGKSFVGSALGHQACLKEYKVKYFNCLSLFRELKVSKADGSYSKVFKKLNKMDLLIFDDFGLQVMDNISRLILLELLEERYDRKSVIIISQLPISNWHEIVGDPTIADAICDRIVHKAITLDLKGESMRKAK
jgi:DNA replication protein DnaC